MPEINPLDLRTVTIVDAAHEPGESGDGATTREIAAAILAGGWRPPAREITDPAELADINAVPRGTIVHSRGGTIACRFDETLGVMFGDDRPIVWSALQLPATVLHAPENGDTR